MRKSKTMEIDSHLFPQLKEALSKVSSNSFIQSIKINNGKIFYRIVSMVDSEFDDVLYFAKSSSSYVPLYFEEFLGNKNEPKEIKALEVTFLSLMKMYSIYGVSNLYRLVSKDGDLLFTITDREINLDNPQKVINAKIKKQFSYFNGSIISNINYLKVVKDL